MDHRKSLALGAVLLAVLCGNANAGYAQVAVPPGWSGSAGGWTFNPSVGAANGSTFLNNTVRTNTALNVGGRAVTMPAAVRFAANAPRIAARFAFANPAMMLASGAYFAYQYYKDNDLDVDPVTQTWRKKVAAEWPPSCPQIAACTEERCTWYPVGPGSERPLSTSSTGGGIQRDGFCSYYQLITGYFGPGTFFYRAGTELPVLSGVPAASYASVTPEEFENRMAAQVIPDPALPWFPWPLPVELPVVNPSSDPSPSPVPLRIPGGQPQLVPNSSPQQWVTPSTDVIPSPTQAEPWRVDVQPKDVFKTDSTPVPEYNPLAPPVPAADPNPVTNPGPGTSAAPKTAEQFDLCAAYPGILACQKSLCALDPNIPACKAVTDKVCTGNPDAPGCKDFCVANPERASCAILGTSDITDTVPASEKTLTMTEDTGWGGNGSCPAPRHLNLSVVPGGVDFSYQLVCDFMGGLRPIIIALAFLAAGMIVLSGRAN